MAIDESQLQEAQARLKERDDFIRESWIRAMEVRIVREELEKCHKSEGVNHYETCKSLRELYMQKLTENRVKGYKNVNV